MNQQQEKKLLNLYQMMTDPNYKQSLDERWRLYNRAKEQARYAKQVADQEAAHQFKMTKLQAQTKYAETMRQAFADIFGADRITDIPARYYQ